MRTLNFILTIKGGGNWSVRIDPETRNQSVLWLRDTVDCLKIANKQKILTPFNNQMSCNLIVTMAMHSS